MRAALAMLILAPLALAQGDRQRGLELYQQGDWAAAAEAFRSALERDGPNAEVSYNLALALWRSGDRDGAESAIEEMAALADGGQVARHYGLLGAVRYDEARELQQVARAAGQVPPPAGQGAAPGDPVALLQQALQKAYLARNHSARAGSAGGATPQIARNLERSLRLANELEKELEEAKQKQQKQEQNQEQKDDEKQEKKDEESKDEQQKQDEQKQPEQQKNEEQQKQDEQQQSEQKEPSPQDQQQQSEQEQEAKPSRDDAPGEQQSNRELSPEEKQRLMDQLKKLEEMLQAYRAQLKASQRKVEKDW